MALSDELTKLDELRVRGVLSDTEFQRAKDRLLTDPWPQPHSATGVSADPFVNAINQLRRSRSDRWVGGVCGGVARITGIESWIWRLIVAALAVFGGIGVIVYLLLWIFVPQE